MSKETKWTPGPWVGYQDFGSNRFYIAQKEGAPYTHRYSDVCVLNCHTWEGEIFTVQQANAHLIAAAPELYEALEQAMEYIISVSFDKCTVSKAVYALAKARGEK